MKYYFDPNIESSHVKILLITVQKCTNSLEFFTIKNKWELDHEIESEDTMFSKSGSSLVTVKFYYELFSGIQIQIKKKYSLFLPF